MKALLSVLTSQWTKLFAWLLIVWLLSWHILLTHQRERYQLMTVGDRDIVVLDKRSGSVYTFNFEPNNELVLPK